MADKIIMGTSKNSGGVLENSLKKALLLLLGISLFPCLLMSETALGRIIYLEGIVDLHRDGRVIELFENCVGMEVFNQDLIETGADGRLSLEIISLQNQGSVFSVSENTAFFLDYSSSRGASKLQTSLLAGSVSFKVQKLLGSEELLVRGPSAVMGVRGTDFEVVLAPEGSLLVICPSGLVECQDELRRTEQARPGTVVEKRSGESLRKIDIQSGEEELYKVFWSSQREQVFKAGASTFIKAYAQQYQTLLPQFAQSYQKISAHQETLLRYNEVVSNLGSLNRDLLLAYNEISRDLIPAMGIVTLFEQIFYSIKVLQRYHSQGIGVSRLSSTQTSQDFFNNFNSYEPVLQRQLSQIHYIYKLYSQMTSVISPFEGEPLWGNSPALGLPPDMSLPQF